MVDKPTPSDHEAPKAIPQNNKKRPVSKGLDAGLWCVKFLGQGPESLSRRGDFCLVGMGSQKQLPIRIHIETAASGEREEQGQAEKEQKQGFFHRASLTISPGQKGPDSYNLVILSYHTPTPLSIKSFFAKRRTPSSGCAFLRGYEGGINPPFPAW